MTADGDLCPELGPGGRRCRRWDQPAAHTDGWHQSDAYRWACVRRPRLLDLFAGAQGAAVGYARAGFEVRAVDIEKHARHPEVAEFIQADALDVLRDHDYLRTFDIVTGSPPCQFTTKAQRIQGNDHPNLIPPMRDNVRAAGVPYVIENVVGAPLYAPLELCGCMFQHGPRPLRTYRERWFESPLLTLGPPHTAHRWPLAKMGRPPKPGQFMHCVGNFSDVEAGRRAMDIDWMTRDDLREAIPWRYTHWIGEQVIDQLTLAQIGATA